MFLSITQTFSIIIPVIVSTKYGTESIKYQGPLIWNDLSKIIPSINEAHTLTLFKNIIKKHFICLQYSIIIEYRILIS